MPTTFNLDQLIRANIRKMKPYSSARDEYSGTAEVYLDANENPFNNGLNRYPDPHQKALKQRIAQLKKVKPEQVFLGNGSDEPIDLLFRAFCEPGLDHAVFIAPSYGMYEVAANTNNVAFSQVQLTPEFHLDTEAILLAAKRKHGATVSSKLIFLCSPNNPSGNLLDKAAVKLLLDNFKGLVVVDEAYIDFAGDKGWLPELSDYPNLVVLQTLSKAWGMAGIRLGMAFASAAIVSVLDKIKPPYNINELTQQAALKALQDVKPVQQQISQIVEERGKLAHGLRSLSFVQRAYPSKANFLLVKTNDAPKVYDYCLSNGIILRDRSKMPGCEGCVRVTVGTPDENLRLLEVLRSLR
ncbi:histidinol-phosphate transaminase [soil metagenome]